MEKRMLLTEAGREAALKDLSGWTYHAETRAIRRTFHFADFAQAFAFMTRVALAAEKADHHPDWSNSWNKVDVALSTHSAGGVTGLDLTLARLCDAAAGLPSGAPPLK
jgi:4a-hydroxytetrahydrobiopterin dehydratase